MAVGSEKKPKPSTDLDDFGDQGKPEDQVSWNTKTDPVPFGYQVNRFGSFLTQEGVRESKSVPYNQAVNYLNEVRGKGGKDYKIFLSQLQRYNNSESTSASGVESMWKNVLDDAEASGANVMDLLQRGTKIPTDGGSRGGGGGVSRYTGPVSSVTLMNERDLRSTADAVASTVIGRAITEEEFSKILKQVRSAERTEPTVSTQGIASSVTQSGLSAEGRQDIIRDALMKGPEAEDYAKATTMMDIFNKALESRPEGA
jgi:hypothetical protein